jgi:hypothetical protein
MKLGEKAGDRPVNVRPKTSSLEGTSSLGVVVLVIDSSEGLISARFVFEAASALML